MPQAVAAFAANAAAAALPAGVSTGAAIAASATVYWTTYIATTAALSYAANAAFAPKPPPMASVDTPLKQSLPPRQSGFGRTRLSGPYALFEAKNGVSSDVVALHDGEIDGYERYFLHDDEVVISDETSGGVICPADLRKYAYGTDPGDRVFINTTLGLATETAFSRPINDVPEFWSVLCRGDGIAALNLTCKQSKQKYQQEDFPNGVPQPSVVARLQKVYDPREGQDQADPSTYEWSANPVLALMAYLTTAPGGMGLDFATRIAPAIDRWIDAADDCDRAMALVAGGTEPRYACGGVYQHVTNPSDVVNALIQSFDGWLSQRGDGALTVLSGVYVEPTVTLRDEHVIAYQVQHFQTDEEAVNVLVPSFSDPETLYKTNDAGAWRDEADIAARGVERSETLSLPWVQSPSQARRLAKRRMSRLTAPLRGTVTCNLYGFNGLGERYLRFRIRENAALDNIVVEVSRVRMDLAAMQVTFEWVQADPDIDAWNRFAEENPADAPIQRPEVAALSAPAIDSVTPVYALASSSDQGARLSIDVDAPIEADVEWKVRWREAGDTDWTEGVYSDIDDGASVTLATGFVLASGDVEVQVAYVTAGGTSPWSETETVNLDAPTSSFEDAVEAIVGAIGQPFGFSFSRSVATLTTSAAVCRFDPGIPWSLPTGLPDAQGNVDSAPTADTAFDIQVGGVSVGTMTFANGATTATFTKASTTAVPDGTPTTVVAPSNLNGMSGLLDFSITGVR